MTRTFIKNPELIEESYQVEDLLDFSSIINYFEERINKIKKNSIIGLIGPYGSGKSTMLYQIYKGKININKDEISNNQTSGSELKQQKEQWFVFDAWQYPERKDLWEGFVLDITRQYNQELFKNTESQIEGNAEKEEKAMATAGVEILATFIPGASALKNLPYFFQNSPIKKVYDFQELFLNIINKEIKKDIFIIVEDIDRSGDMGVFFLETLKYFIKTQEKNMNHKVMVIVPIGNNAFYKSQSTRDSYLKILDYQVPFNPGLINFTNFIERTIDIGIAIENTNNANKESWEKTKKKETENRQAVKHNIQQMGHEILDIQKSWTRRIHTDKSFREIFMRHIRYLFEIMILNEKQGTIRDIKSILRKAKSNFNELNKSQQKLIDIRILILFTTIEYFYRDEKNDSCSFSCIQTIDESPKKRTWRIEDQFWGRKLLLIIMQNVRIFNDVKDEKFIIDTSYDRPWLPERSSINDGNIDYFMNDIYFTNSKVKINYLGAEYKLSER